MSRLEIRKMILAAVLVALGVVLARVFHAMGGWQAGSIFLPMHITVLLCGFFCGWKYGMLCGILTPLTAFLVSGMPNGMTLFIMILELACYGLMTGLLYKLPAFSKIASGQSGDLLKIVIVLVLSMLAGRAVWGIAKALTSIGQENQFGWSAFMAGAFITAWPGIVIQLFTIPAVVFLVRKGNVWKES